MASLTSEDQLKLALALRTILVDATIERFFRSRILLQVLRSVTGTLSPSTAVQLCAPASWGKGEVPGQPGVSCWQLSTHY